MLPIAMTTGKTQRKLRSPQHKFQTRISPYSIEPFCLAPVLPGETLKSALWQIRAVTDPIQNPLLGWWHETYLFYVKHRDLEQSDAYQSMMLDAAWDNTAYDHPTADVSWYHPAGTGSINWTKECTKAVVNEYFRNDGEVWSDYVINTDHPIASIAGNSMLDSAMLDTEFDDPDVTISTAGDNAFTTQEFQTAWEQFVLLKQQGLTDQTYEEYLSTFGVRLPRSERIVPELIRMDRNWSYPSNTIDPTDGSPSSAVSWALSGRADKDRFFKEPGFILGLNVIRPKVYISQQTGGLTAFMNDAKSWLPAILGHNPQASFKKFATTTGPLPSVSADYWIDIRDLLMYGDQYCNFALSATDAGLVALPTTGLQHRYVPNIAAIQALFVDSTNASGKTLVRQDGIITFNIMGAQVDHSPRITA